MVRAGTRAGCSDGNSLSARIGRHRRANAHLRASEEHGLGHRRGVEVGVDVRQVAQRVLERASNLAKAHGLKYVCETREGRAAEEIIKAAGQLSVT